MKSLKESLFDKDIIEKDLPIEQIVNKIFNSKELKNINDETRISWLINIWDLSKQYSIQKLKNLNIDISETPIIIRLGNLNNSIEDPYKIFFLFKPDQSKNYIYDFHVLLSDYKGYPWSMNINQYWNQLQGYKKTLSNLILSMKRNYFEEISWGLIENKILKDKIAKGLKSIYFREKT